MVNQFYTLSMTIPKWGELCANVKRLPAFPSFTLLQYVSFLLTLVQCSFYLELIFEVFFLAIHFTIVHILTHTFVWENIENFKPLMKPQSQVCSNFKWSLLGVGEWKIAKMVMVHWPRWPPFQYMVKTFKNLLQNQVNPGHNLCTDHRVWRSTKIAKMMVLCWCSTFL